MLKVSSFCVQVLLAKMKPNCLRVFSVGLLGGRVIQTMLTVTGCENTKTGYSGNPTKLKLKHNLIFPGTRVHPETAHTTLL